MKKRIIQFFASKTWGGGEQFVYDLSKELMADDYEVVFASHKSNVIKQKVSELRTIKGEQPLYYQIGRGFNPLSVLKFLRIVLKFNPDIVHTHSHDEAHTALQARALARLLGRDYKVIMTRHLYRKHSTGLKYRYIYKQLDRLVFVAEATRRVFMSGIKQEGVKEKSCVILNSRPEVVDIPEIDIRKELNLSSDVVIFMYCGRVTEEKGILPLLEAVKRVPEKNIVLLLVGAMDNKIAQIVQSQVEGDLLGRVLLLGFRNDVPSLIKACDVCVQPSIVAEAGSLSVIESMQYSKPLIASNNGSQSEFIDNGINGILIAPNDVVALSANMSLLANDVELRKKIGNASYKKYKETLSWKQFVDKYKALYESLLSK